MINIEKITNENQKALKLPNEKFELYGKLIVTRANNLWNYHEILTETETMVFPDENYQLDIINKKGFALGAFENDECVGLAIFENNWNKHLYLSDLKVSSSHRRKNIASMLLDAAISEAKTKEIYGLYTIAQDNNLSANRFYLRYGFEIGGLNTKDYSFTNQEGKYDIYYYLDF
ncbi:GNAT family N-acetyltransferase [Mammaliicoccus fleurettii]|uniref:GNAT family N-acetyltransferase n=1 Tax=Mammaliicoccus fleurettii TaxID=150056 RepID=UPI002DB879BE|nr:GNAT family N-acetyltransferase [Mammaliicoccus fleurettii]MEB8067252.1 GNAT family N-acetyltransferase [Mammaliicoccus fleurettii]